MYPFTELIVPSLRNSFEAEFDSNQLLKKGIAYAFKEHILPFFLIFLFLLKLMILVNPSYHQYIKKDKGRYSCSICVILLLNQNTAEIHKKYII